MTEEREPNLSPIILDSHKILGLKHPSSLQEVKSAHRRLVIEYHPDNKPPEQRMKYDRLLLNVNLARDLLQVYYTNPSAAAMKRAQEEALRRMRIRLLESAAYHNNPAEIERLVKENGVDVNMNLDGTTALHIASDVDNGGGYEAIRKLLELGAKPNARDIYGRRPLHYVIGSRQDFSSIVKLLKENKARLNLKDEDGRTPLDYRFDKHAHPGFSEFSKKDYRTLELALKDSLLVCGLYDLHELISLGAKLSNFDRVKAVGISEELLYCESHHEVPEETRNYLRRLREFLDRALNPKAK